MAVSPATPTHIDNGKKAISEPSGRLVSQGSEASQDTLLKNTAARQEPRQRVRGSVQTDPISYGLKRISATR